VRRAIETGPEQALGIPLPMSLPIAALPPPIMADVPALTAPVIDVVFSERRPQTREIPRAGGGQVRQMLMRHDGHGPIQILLLDPAYLREKLVTSLASSRVDSESPFEWSVVKGDGTRVAGAAFDVRADKADASAPVLRLRMDELDKSFLRGVLPGLGRVISDSSVRFVVQMSSSTSTISVNGGTTPSSTAPWTLRLRHRSGSIDAAVLAQQRRNSALSASVLGVLGLSAGMVFFSARRLRATATRQVEFVAAVSHELRTPLAVIRSAADNLADGVVDGRDQARRYGALIRSESVRLADMVEHVLEFAGADSAGRSTRGSIDAGEAARAAVKAMGSLAAERNAEVSLDAPPTPLTVNGDLSHLTRAITNLIGNALKYGGDAPRVTVRVARGTHGVEISVADQGSGLDTSEIPRLFEPFYRGHRASEAQIPGSGLGLALVKRIVESHGGRVVARNNPEGGALFTIALPAV
jgi:signal transduction histidine kinase